MPPRNRNVFYDAFTARYEQVLEAINAPNPIAGYYEAWSALNEVK